MTDGVEFRIHDLDTVVDTMRGMAPRLRNRGLRTAVRRGAMIVRRAARANARLIDDPETRAAIWRAIGMQYSRRESKRENGVVYRVGVRGGAREAGQARDSAATYHWRFLEFGTSKMAAKPFMRRALADNVQRTTNEVVTALTREIGKLANEGAARARGRGSG